MLNKNSLAIDWFYKILILTLILLAVMVVFTARSIFSALKTSRQINEQAVEAIPRVDQAKLDAVYEEAIQKRGISLDLVK